MKFCVTLYPSEWSREVSTSEDVLNLIRPFLGKSSIQLINIEQYEEKSVFKVRDTRGHAGK